MRGVKKSTNELIRIRKRKKAIRKSVFFTIVTVVAVIILCLKHPYFNVSTIVVNNNSIVATEDIEKLSDIKIERNIFSFRKKEVKENLLSNSYISEVSIKRKLPSTVIIEVVERKPKYYIVSRKEYVLIDSIGYVLERVQSIKGFDLVELAGIEGDAALQGNNIVSDKKNTNQIEVFSDLIDRNLSDITISSIDVQSSADIKVYFGDILVKVGSIDRMESKLNKAINIITQQNIKNAKGYIDVSFNGDPVISIEE